MAGILGKDMTGQFNTELSEEDEKKFQAWAKQNNRLGDLYDYDLRGAWKELNEGSMSEDDRGHLGDKYKKPSHPTFSAESIYAKDAPDRAGSWGIGPKGTNVYTTNGLSPQELKYLQRYFWLVEPNSILEVFH